MAKIDFAVGIGGAAGQGIATPGDILAMIFARRGLPSMPTMPTNPLFAAATRS